MQWHCEGTRAGEERQQLAERRPDRRAAAVEQHERGSRHVLGSVQLVVHLQPVHRRIAALDSGREDRQRRRLLVGRGDAGEGQRRDERGESPATELRHRPLPGLNAWALPVPSTRCVLEAPTSSFLMRRFGRLGVPSPISCIAGRSARTHARRRSPERRRSCAPLPGRLRDQNKTVVLS